MFKEMIMGLTYILVITIILYPISTTFADTMALLMGTDTLSLLLITIVR